MKTLTSRHPFRCSAWCGPLARAVAVLALLLFAGARATEIRCLGGLGNSGEAGADLVRGGELNDKTVGLGVACDAEGCLWSGLGNGVLNQYAPDGRLLATYRIPTGNGRNARDVLVLCGNTLLLKLGKTLYGLPLPAKPEAVPAVLRKDTDRLSLSARDGWVAVSSGREVTLWAPATGESRPVATLTRDLDGLELDDLGAVYVQADGKLYQFRNGKEVTDGGWPKGSPGECPQFIDGFWFAHSWHGTIKRYDRDLNPVPGVVLGGKSGHFIGRLDENVEVLNGRGLARLREDLYAVSGMGGIVHLLAWDPVKTRFEIVRRLGSALSGGALSVARDGAVWWFAGSWPVGSGPDSPLVEGSGDLERQSQAALLPGNGVVFAGWKWSRPSFGYGQPGTLLGVDRIDSDPPPMLQEPRAAAVLTVGNTLELAVASAKGDGHRYRIGRDGRFHAYAGPLTIQASKPLQNVTAFAVVPDGPLLAAADGAILQLVPGDQAGTYKETTRRDRCGEQPADVFGATLHIAADAGRLWIADSARQRVLCVDPVTLKPLAAFGQLDTPGNDLAHLSAPLTIAARGDQAVVWDSANQRLLRLQFVP